MSIAPYLNLITSEHQNKPNFIAWLSAALTVIDDGETAASSVITAFDVDNAVGVQLDTIGARVGANRQLGVNLTTASSSLLDDDHFRILIKAQIAKNSWDGTIISLYEIWNTLFPQNSLQIIDNQDMTIQAIVNNVSDLTFAELISDGLIIPEPMGVEVTIIQQTPISGSPFIGAIVGGGYDVVKLTTV